MTKSQFDRAKIIINNLIEQQIKIKCTACKEKEQKENSFTEICADSEELMTPAHKLILEIYNDDIMNDVHTPYNIINNIEEPLL